MRIPKQIKGYGFVYPIFQKKNYKWLGTINHKKGYIVLQKNQHHCRKESSLLHELIHMVSSENDLNLKETQVNLLETGLYQILKDNKLLK